MTFYSKYDPRPDWRFVFLADQLQEFGSGLVRRLAERREASRSDTISRREVAALKTLPDHVLSDIGLNRTGIEHIVYFGGPRQRPEPNDAATARPRS